MFGKRKDTEPGLSMRTAHLEAEVARLASAFRQLETEQLAMHSQVQRWMRRAVAAERAAERNQDSSRRTSPPAPPAPSTPAPSRRLSSARLRAAASGREWGAGGQPPSVPASLPFELIDAGENGDETNGVHS